MVFGSFLIEKHKRPFSECIIGISAKSTHRWELKLDWYLTIKRKVGWIWRSIGRKFFLLTVIL